MKTSICVLLYGNHPELANRCLRSVWDSLKRGSRHVSDIRLGLNEISDATQVVVDWFLESIVSDYQISVLTYECPVNAFKYPLMRRMLLEDPVPPGDWVMWLDDDSFIASVPDWWDRLVAAASHADMLGKIYWQCIQPKQWEWIQRQAWFNSEVGYPPPAPRKLKTIGGRPAFRFCTGGWWMARPEIFTKHDWPTRDLKLVGGDAMLGELCRHQDYRLVNFETGVHINAGVNGRHNSAPPRGESPQSAGRNRVRLGIADSPAAEIHNFTCTRRRIN